MILQITDDTTSDNTISDDSIDRINAPHTTKYAKLSQ